MPRNQPPKHSAYIDLGQRSTHLGSGREKWQLGTATASAATPGSTISGGGVFSGGRGPSSGTSGPRLVGGSGTGDGGWSGAGGLWRTAPGEPRGFNGMSAVENTDRV